MRGLYKIHGAVQTAEAWKDWKGLKILALIAGWSDLVEQYEPRPDAGWRIIDKQIKKLRGAMDERMQERQHTQP